ncbi:MAG: hypothetical protein LUE29_09880 [Lachnospiraceae bacterium]|nr:hypothetical protein [Lachnospiraceae bacterium]
MKKIYTNAALGDMLRTLRPFMSRKDKIGYISARNCRTITNALIDYNKFRDDLIKKYGEPDHDEEGNELPTSSIKLNSPNFKLFCDELAPINMVEQELDLMTLNYSEVFEVLSGDEIFSIDWMLED